VIGSFVLVIPALASATTPGNPNDTGPPSQSCQTVVSTGGTTPGRSAGSPGAPFNEPGSGSNTTNPGGTGGLNYNQKSQYDVACYQVSRTTVP
jgi:hypothetical protein